jgi:hypothetical protein
MDVPHCTLERKGARGVRELLATTGGCLPRSGVQWRRPEQLLAASPWRESKDYFRALNACLRACVLRRDFNALTKVLQKLPLAKHHTPSDALLLKMRTVAVHLQEALGLLVTTPPGELKHVDVRLDVLIRHTSLLWFVLASSPSSPPSDEVGGLLVHSRSLSLLVQLAEKVAAGTAVTMDEGGEEEEEEDEGTFGNEEVAGEETGMGRAAAEDEPGVVTAPPGDILPRPDWSEDSAGGVDPMLATESDSHSALLAAVRWAIAQRWFRSGLHKDFLSVYLNRLNSGHTTPRAHSTPARFKLRRA